jgi:hypothetical protein
MPQMAGCTSTQKALPDPASRPTQTFQGTPVQDGDRDVSATCTVRESAGSYSVSTTIAWDTVAADALSFSLSGTITGTAGTAQSVSFFLRSLESNFENVDAMGAKVPCTLGAISIQPGAVWGSFSCPSVRDPSIPNAVVCQATGYYLLENCRK